MLKKIFCKHNYIFEKNIHGDAINKLDGMRSQWICTKCNKISFKNPFITEEVINEIIKNNSSGSIISGRISDGYHTFDELYDHRIELYLSLIERMNVEKTKYDVWFSYKHHDGSSYNGWVIVGVNNNFTREQISYHVPESYVENLRELGIVERIKALEWDGHSSSDVLKRINNWCRIDKFEREVGEMIEGYNDLETKNQNPLNAFLDSIQEHKFSTDIKDEGYDICKIDFDKTKETLDIMEKNKNLFTNRIVPFRKIVTLIKNTKSENLKTVESIGNLTKEDLIESISKIKENNKKVKVITHKGTLYKLKDLELIEGLDVEFIELTGFNRDLLIIVNEGFKIERHAITDKMDYYACTNEDNEVIFKTVECDFKLNDNSLISIINLGTENDLKEYLENIEACNKSC